MIANTVVGERLLLSQGRPLTYPYPNPNAEPIPNLNPNLNPDPNLNP